MANLSEVKNKIELLTHSILFNLHKNWNVKNMLVILGEADLLCFIASC